MYRSGIIIAAAICVLAPAVQAQDAENGEKLFKKCVACHQVGEGAKNRAGPVLTGVVGRAAGTFDSYKYGTGMKAAGEAGLVWDADNLFEYLADPTKFLRAELDDPKAKGKMKFKLKKEHQRRDVIAYLGTFSEAVESEEQSALPESGMVETAANAVCVRNRSSHEHLFAVEAEGGERHVRMLKTGEILCTETMSAQGVVSVFEKPEELEGCSRIVAVGKTEDMLKYVDFDRCFWGSNS